MGSPGRIDSTLLKDWRDSAVTSMGEQDLAGEPRGDCEVRALSPETRRDGDEATAVWAQAQYRCSQTGTLIVRLMRMQYFVGPIQASLKEFGAPASPSWSEVFRTDETACVSHSRRTKYYTEAKHAHTDGTESLDGSDTIPACS